MSYLYHDQTYQIIGACMEVHKVLGRGLKEIVYKDALQHEFRIRKIPFEREVEYVVAYKDIILPHSFYADFVVFDNIILEIKAMEDIHDEHINQTLNYIAIAKSPLGMVVNFGSGSLQHRRVILT
ncbi:MAG: GxxExxY protein [Candidatus Competibacteraceae bacterium]|nr:GxxExxY protein [Candidatus Competibacteraceae bacterium]